jgi:hypothetical protein
MATASVAHRHNTVQCKVIEAAQEQCLTLCNGTFAIIHFGFVDIEQQRVRSFNTGIQVAPESPT